MKTVARNVFVLKLLLEDDDDTNVFVLKLPRESLVIQNSQIAGHDLVLQDCSGGNVNLEK
jgi:hypothetical protein